MCHEEYLLGTTKPPKLAMQAGAGYLIINFDKFLISASRRLHHYFFQHVPNFFFGPHVSWTVEIQRDPTHCAILHITVAHDPARYGRHERLRSQFAHDQVLARQNVITFRLKLPSGRIANRSTADSDRPAGRCEARIVIGTLTTISPCFGSNPSR